MLDESCLFNIGAYQYGYISPSEICFGEEVRNICKNNGCGSYNTTWACPPAMGTLEECKEKCLSYSSAMLFSSKYLLEDSFDYEGMMTGHSNFKLVCDRLYNIVKKEFSAFMILSNEGCRRCKKCTYPKDKCRHEEMLFPSLEGYGIYVNKTAELANINYCNGTNTVTYFGMLLFSKL